MAIRHVPMARSIERGADDPVEAALEAYTFAYPLMLMDATRQLATHVAHADHELGTGAPLNEFSHLCHLPGLEQDELELGAVCRPSFDTLYSSLWFDVSEEPLIVSVPDSHGRFYALWLMDQWSERFASIGARTTGTAARAFAITAPGYTGELPAGVWACPSPTAEGWLLALSHVRGVADVGEVARFQRGLEAMSWSQWRSGRALSCARVRRGRPPLGPDSVLSHLSPREFLARFCELTRNNPPHPGDGPVLARLRRLGIVPGRPFAPEAVPRALWPALELARALLPGQLARAHEQSFRVDNQWRAALPPRGGADYLRRASAAHAGLGAQASEDAVVFTTSRDETGAPLRSSEPYVLRFSPGQAPPARASWSLTLYDEQQRPAQSALGRCTLGSGDELIVEPDGSLSLHLQRESPGQERERNWLPAPASGELSASLRLYWPTRAVLEGTWSPPPVQRGQSSLGPSELWFSRGRVARVYES